MKSLLLGLGFLFVAAPAWALSLAVYDLVPNDPSCQASASCELSGAFTYDPSHADPFVAWDFRYDFPTAIISGSTWSTSDGGFYVPDSHELLVTNAQNLTLTYQLCFQICSDLPNTYAMNIFDNRAQQRYSAGGFFSVDGNGAPVASVSVPEPAMVWSLLVGCAGVIALMAWQRRHGLRTALGLSLLLVCASPSWAQMATETTPGTTWYDSPNGGTTLGVEVTPGYRHFSGDVIGSSTTIVPGITNYSLQSGSWEQQFEADVRADLANRRRLFEQMMQEREGEYRRGREFLQSR